MRHVQPYQAEKTYRCPGCDHEIAIGLGWDRVHKALHLTKPFYDRFTPAIAASDF